MTEQELKTWKDKLDDMSQVDLARLWRFSDLGCPVFSEPELYECFKTNFKGFTPEISKLIGWDR